ncbi:hypothetical protein D187_006614 [Cystobacter fuscus DSM 2262]|uniref:Uncharacterized protein n=1 Tax=Cystobacter fuscus (strain ATCC 25194 / DSM 2262 / NBRC 100088 / M29) TaxID=1242864 RepID=S9Q7X2_CYSF2|nr:hypothetical protein [Cystobacter fuscus]EPX57439.1 hypothetical protein D187_006614 [Cystobacter fuscus DSM 2262]
MTKYNVNFDVESVLRTVEALGRNQPEGTLEEESLRVCAAALLFVREDPHKLDEFREYFRRLTPPAVEGVKVDHVFATREAAETWLKQGDARDGQRLRVAGQGFTVIDLGARGLKLVRMPLPEELPPHKP